MLDSTFKPPLLHFNGHAQSIFPSLFRKVKIEYRRERLELNDGDFIDLDWHEKGSENLVIVTHGLEGDSTRHYVTGLIKKFSDKGFDGLGWNCRSCSGEMNRLPRFYHHGDANDLKAVVEYAVSKQYKKIYLVGFSMGGSLTIRYLAENSEILSSKIIGATTASVPLDLTASVKELDKPGKRFYQKRFLKKLFVKLKVKSATFPDNKLLDCNTYWQNIKNFEDFDNTYTAPLHGFENAQDFYAKASSKPLLGKVNVPVNIIQAINDPFLTPECLEIDSFKNNKNLVLILTQKGGHVGFRQAGKFFTYTEEKAYEHCNYLLSMVL